MTHIIPRELYKVKFILSKFDGKHSANVNPYTDTIRYIDMDFNGNPSKTVFEALTEFLASDKSIHPILIFLNQIMLEVKKHVPIDTGQTTVRVAYEQERYGLGNVDVAFDGKRVPI